MRIEEKEKTVVQKWNVYISDDGEEFTSEDSCVRHETDLTNKSLYKYDIDMEKVKNPTNDDFDDFKFHFLNCCVINTHSSNRGYGQVNNFNNYKRSLVDYPNLHQQLDTLPKVRGFMLEAFINSIHFYEIDLVMSGHVTIENTQARNINSKVPEIEFINSGSRIEFSISMINVYQNFFTDSNILNFDLGLKDLIKDKVLNHYFSGHNMNMDEGVRNIGKIIEYDAIPNYDCLFSIFKSILTRDSSYYSTKDSPLVLQESFLVHDDGKNLTNNNKIIYYTNSNSDNVLDNLMNYLKDNIDINELLQHLLKGCVDFYRGWSSGDHIYGFNSSDANPFFYVATWCEKNNIDTVLKGVGIKKLIIDIITFIWDEKANSVKFTSSIASFLLEVFYFNGGYDKLKNTIPVCNRITSMIDSDIVVEKILTTKKGLTANKLYPVAKKKFETKLEELMIPIRYNVSEWLGDNDRYYNDDSIIVTINDEISKEDFVMDITNNGIYFKGREDLTIHHIQGVSNPLFKKAKSSNKLLNKGDEVKVKCDKIVKNINIWE